MLAYRLLALVIDYCKKQLDDTFAESKLSSSYQQALLDLISACKTVQKYH